MFTFKRPASRYLSDNPKYIYHKIKFGDARDKDVRGKLGKKDETALEGLGSLLIVLLGIGAVVAFSIATCYVGFVILRGVWRWALKQ